MAKGSLGLWGKVALLKNNAVLLYYAWKHPRTPVHINVLLLALVLYVFSPIDIIPDYLPLIGITDDVTLITLGLPFLARLLPENVKEECFNESKKWRRRIPIIFGIVVFFIVAWVVFVMLGIAYLLVKMTS